MLPPDLTPTEAREILAEMEAPEDLCDCPPFECCEHRAALPWADLSDEDLDRLAELARQDEPEDAADSYAEPGRPAAPSAAVGYDQRLAELEARARSGLRLWDPGDAIHAVGEDAELRPSQANPQGVRPVE